MTRLPGLTPESLPHSHTSLFLGHHSHTNQIFHRRWPTGANIDSASTTASLRVTRLHLSAILPRSLPVGVLRAAKPQI